jgi:hypothetical protein
MRVHKVTMKFLIFRRRCRVALRSPCASLLAVISIELTALIA